MKVRATEVGWIGLKLRQIGDEFDIDEREFSDKWMEKVEKDAEPEEHKQEIRVEVAPVEPTGKAYPEMPSEPLVRRGRERPRKLT
jgi:hypothetical protein